MESLIGHRIRHSILALESRSARVAQLVEHFHGKEGVTSSSLVPGLSTVNLSRVRRSLHPGPAGPGPAGPGRRRTGSRRRPAVLRARRRSPGAAPAERRIGSLTCSTACATSTGLAARPRCDWCCAGATRSRRRCGSRRGCEAAAIHLSEDFSRHARRARSGSGCPARGGGLSCALTPGVTVVEPGELCPMAAATTTASSPLTGGLADSPVGSPHPGAASLSTPAVASGSGGFPPCALLRERLACTPHPGGRRGRGTAAMGRWLRGRARRLRGRS